MIFKRIVNESCMSYLIACENTKRCMIADASGSFDKYLDLVKSYDLKVTHVLDTHTHADHLSARKQFSSKLNAETVMHENALAKTDIRLTDGEKFSVGELELRVIHTPGHTPDSMCLLIQNKIITGDTLLCVERSDTSLCAESGRTDLPGGDPYLQFDSLFNKLMKLDDSILVFPAHCYGNSPFTTIGHERKNSAALRFKSREEFAEFMSLDNSPPPKNMNRLLKQILSDG